MRQSWRPDGRMDPRPGVGFVTAIVGALVGALIGGGLWAVVAITVGLSPLGFGFLVALGVGVLPAAGAMLGRSLVPPFAAALFAVLGCVLGDLLMAGHGVGKLTGDGFGSGLWLAVHHIRDVLGGRIGEVVGSEHVVGGFTPGSWAMHVVSAAAAWGISCDVIMIRRAIARRRLRVAGNGNHPGGAPVAHDPHPPPPGVGPGVGPDVGAPDPRYPNGAPPARDPGRGGHPPQGPRP